MIIRQGGRIYCNTPETSPDWECFRPAKDCDYGEDVVTFKGIDGRWKYETSFNPMDIVAMVVNECKND